MGKLLTEKCLIHIVTTYNSKNKLQALALEKLKTADGLLMESFHAGIELLDDLLAKAHNECQTRCTPITWSGWNRGTDTNVINKDLYGLIYISLLPVYELNSIS